MTILHNPYALCAPEVCKIFNFFWEIRCFDDAQQHTSIMMDKWLSVMTIWDV